MGTWLKRSVSKKKYVLKHEESNMDKILEALFISNKPDTIKEGVVNKICEQGSQPATADNIVNSVLLVSSKWCIQGTSQLQINSGFKLFNAWGSNNLNAFLSFFTPSLTSDLLTGYHEQMISANIPLLLRDGFRILMKAGHRHISVHVPIVQKNITSFLYKSQSCLAFRHAGFFLEEFQNCLPQNDNSRIFCLTYIDFLKRAALPHNGDDIKIFVKTIDEIASFLCKICTPQLLNNCLNEIFNIISTPKAEDAPSTSSICFASLVKHIPMDVMNSVVMDVVTDRAIKDEFLEAALGQIIEWLVWPKAQNVDSWLLCFLIELAKAQKYAVLIRVIEDNTETIAEHLADYKLRQPCFKVLSQMLLGFQHSPGPFHKFLSKMPFVINKVKDEGTIQSWTFLKDLSELIYELMYQHTGFPEIYAPILDLIKDFPSPNLDTIKARLNETQWLTNSDCMEGTEINPSAVLNSLTKQKKLELGKTGLENLGNTCYMNSVLQALYMCDQFRQDVLVKTPSPQEGLLVKLQHVFAHLSQSFRPTMAPSKFLHASRPPWFLPGHQQDCSEFLKFMLDRLHEDEKSSAPSSVMKKSPSSGSMSPGETALFNPGSLSKTERKKASVTLTSVKMKTDKEMNGFNGNPRNGHLDNGADSSLSLVEKTFRGKVQTTLRCLACKQKSTRVESFDDIPLAFPNSSKSAGYPQKNLAGGNSAPHSMDVVMENQHPEIENKPETNTPNETDFSLNDLISFYLKPEKLTGDNMYHCNKCGKLQDGERSIQIIESPHYLILTLLRFSYDTKLQKRTKIFQDVHYPCTISIPEFSASEDQKLDKQHQHLRHSSDNSLRSNSGKGSSYQSYMEDIAERIAPPCRQASQSSVSYHLYCLTGVVVHSGASSECGHYYCYSRHSNAGQVDSRLLSNIGSSLNNLDLLPDEWYNFNDSLVSKATFESFSKVTKKFSKDTAYVLIYCKLSCGNPTAGINNQLVLRQDLRDAIVKDNEAYLKEIEIENKIREEQQRRRSSSVTSASFSHFRSKDDDDDDDNHTYTSSFGCRDSGLDIHGSRFVF